MVFDITELIEKLFQLTSLSSDVRYNFEKTNVVELMETVVEQNNRFMHNTSYTSLILESDEQEILINVDPFWIRQLLSNLINNAIKHSGATNIKIKIKLTKKNKT